MSLLEEVDGGRGKGEGEEEARLAPSFLMAQFSSVLGLGACGCPASQGALLPYQHP